MQTLLIFVTNGTHGVAERHYGRKQGPLRTVKNGESHPQVRGTLIRHIPTDRELGATRTRDDVDNRVSFRDPGTAKFNEDEKRQIANAMTGVPMALWPGGNITFLRTEVNPFSAGTPATYESDGDYFTVTDDFFKLTPEQQQRVLNHEFAHRWNNQNPQAVTGFWSMNWNITEGQAYNFDDYKRPGAGGKKDGATFPSRRGDGGAYSGSNPLEDFAVSVEAYMYDPDSLDKARRDWIKDNIFNGGQYRKGGEFSRGKANISPSTPGGPHKNSNSPFSRTDSKRAGTPSRR